MAKQQREAEVSLAELQKAEDDLRIAMLQTQGVIDEYSFMSPSDGDFALDKALNSNIRRWTHTSKSAVR